MKSWFKTHALLLLSAITLSLPVAGMAQVIIGNWDGYQAEGWIDHESGLSILDAALTNKYMIEPSMGAAGAALRITQSGWNQNLRLNLQDQGLVDAFMTNNQLRFEFSVPAWTSGGYSGVELVMNVDGYGWNQQYDFTVEGSGHNGNTNGVQIYFWDGSPQRTVVATYNYNQVLNALGGAVPTFVEIIFQSNNGGGAPDYFQINDVTLLAGLPPLLPGSSLPAGVTADSTPTLQTIFMDGTETVDLSSVVMTVDGSAVSPTLEYTNETTTISYTPATPYEGGTVHTAQVIVASSPGGTLYTNEWEFTVLLLDNITYVDASDTLIVMAASPDGAVGAGVPLVTNTTDTADGIWRFRTGFGIAPGETTLPVGLRAVTTGGSGTILESTAWVNPADNTPRLKVTATNLVADSYYVYVYYWTDEAGSPWGIRAALEDLEGVNALPQVTNGVRIATDDASNNEGRQLFQAYLGIATGSSIDVFVEDLPATDGNSRTWFDGIGFEPTPGASLQPDIESIAIAAGSATLSWASELGATYTILHRTNLTDSAWTPVKSGINGTYPTTSDSVPMSGAAQEFYSIEGN